LLLYAQVWSVRNIPIRMRWKYCGMDKGTVCASDKYRLLRIFLDEIAGSVSK
jgi:hypothetical protein